MHVRFFLLIVLLPLTSAQVGAQTEAGTMPDPRIDEAIALMNKYADRTGLVSEQPRRRCLCMANCNSSSNRELEQTAGMLFPRVAV